MILKWTLIYSLPPYRSLLFYTQLFFENIVIVIAIRTHTTPRSHSPTHDLAKQENRCSRSERRNNNLCFLWQQQSRTNVNNNHCRSHTRVPSNRRINPSSEQQQRRQRAFSTSSSSPSHCSSFSTHWSMCSWLRSRGMRWRWHRSSRTIYHQRSSCIVQQWDTRR